MKSRRERSRSSSASKPRSARERRLAQTLALLLLAGLSLIAIGTSSGRASADEGKPASTAPQLSDEESEREAESIARSIMSPFCEGRTVSACPNAGPWREDIRKWVKEGVDAEEIRNRLHARVPQHNLMGVPPNRLGWVLPVGGGLIAVGVLVFALRRLVRPAAAPKAEVSNAADGAAAPAPAQHAGEDWDARLEEELETLER